MLDWNSTHWSSVGLGLWWTRLDTTWTVKDLGTAVDFVLFLGLYPEGLSRHNLLASHHEC